MWKAAFAGAVALVIFDTSLALADSTDGAEQARPAQGLVLTQAHIAKFKSVLKLTAIQEQYWPAVEKAFREMTQHGSDIASSGLVQGISNRASSFGNNAMALRQLAVAAYPLIQSLDEGQKQNALALARTMGLEKLALAF